MNITNGGINYFTTLTRNITGGEVSGAKATPVLTLGTRATFTAAFIRAFNYTWILGTSLIFVLMIKADYR